MYVDWSYNRGCLKNNLVLPVITIFLEKIFKIFHEMSGPDDFNILGYFPQKKLQRI